MTSLSKLSMPRKLPRFSSTPMTSRRRAPILIFLPKGDSLWNKIGGHIVANDADRASALRFVRGEEPALRDGETAGGQELIGRANDRDAAGTAVFVPDRSGSCRRPAPRPGPGASVVPLGGPAARVMSRRLFSLIHILVSSIRPGLAADKEHIRARGSKCCRERRGSGRQWRCPSP